MFARVLMSMFLIFSVSQAKMMFQSVSPKEATIVQKGDDKMYCPNCGMYLPKFWKTSHAVKFKDGTYRQFCSIYCLVEQLEITELRGKQDKIAEYLVVDVASKKYTDAKKAYYVVGSAKKGTMTMTSKYAFKEKADAQKFKMKNGGVVTDFDGAYEVAIEDFARDTGLVAAKRGTKMYKMGKNFYNKLCDKKMMNSFDAHTMGAMKAMIDKTNVCKLVTKGLKRDMQLQAIMLYYWDVKLDKFNELYGENKEIKKHAQKFKKKFEQMKK